MDFRSLLQDIPSEADKQFFIRAVGNSQAKFLTLLDYALHEKDPLAWRAAWVADCSAEKTPSLALPHIATVVRHLPDIESHGTLRCLLRLLHRYSIDEDDQGLLIDLCFRYLVSERYPVAVKVHAMQIIYQHVLLYPELKDELLTVLEDQMPHNTVGFSSRARKIIKALEKM